MSQLKKILIVGHCGKDGPMLQDALSSLKGVPALRINDTATLKKEATSDALLLVNRVLEGRFDYSSGIELIESMKKSAGVKMLISNLPDAQAQAEKVGAVKGFGKAKAYEPATLALVRKTMGI
ncbi:MAG: hypothetical protein IT444_13020 [Phycisphaeraceae bacterium]|nr:hypothetical protein [Phycisphaeraceae bacterium]